ncbi:NAD-binding protein [Planctomycetota bacterium]
MESKSSEKSWLGWMRRVLGKAWHFDGYSHFVLLALGLFVLVSALIGFLIQGGISGHFRSVSLLIFKVGQLFVLESGADPPDNLALAFARFGAVLLVFVGILKLLITVYRDVFDNLRLKGLNHHVLICGLGRIGIQLARDVRKEGRGQGLVVIERDQSNPHIPACREIGALVLIGDATDTEMLLRARAERARQVFAVSGDDTTDVEIAVRLCDLVAPAALRPNGSQEPEPRRDAARLMECFVHIVDLPLKELFSRHTLLPRSRDQQVNVSVFNVFTNSARLLIREYLAKDRPRLSTTGRPEENEVAHYVVVGFGQMGQAFALEAARLAHFENCRRLRMTLIDNKIEAKRDRFLSRYPRFCPEFPPDEDRDPVADDWGSKRYRPQEPYWIDDEEAVEYACNAEFWEMPADLRADQLADQIADRLTGALVRPSIVVCFDDDRRNFEAAILLQAKLSVRLKDAPIYVWLPVQTGLTELLLTSSGSVPAPGGATFAAIDDIIPFGVCEQSCNLEEVIRPGIEELARANHQFYCELFPASDKPSGRSWEDLPEPYRTSNFLVAEHLHVKLAAIDRRRIPVDEAPKSQERDDIKSHEVELLAEMEHNRWLAERLLDGWSHAPARNDERKQHPDLCAWANLPHEEQERDRKQVEYIREILKKLSPAECVVPL